MSDRRLELAIMLNKCLHAVEKQHSRKSTFGCGNIGSKTWFSLTGTTHMRQDQQSFPETTKKKERNKR